MNDPHEDSKAILKSFENVAKKDFDILDLSRNGIQQIPQGLDGLDLSHLKYLYLEGNTICLLPGDFFTSLQSLEWLDLRNNKVQEIPRNVGKHKNLKTLLLGRNKLTFLPTELGFIRTLTGLNVFNNPLKDPPQFVINRGVHAIKHYLLAKLRLNPEDFQSDEGLSDYQSAECGDNSHTDDKEEAKESKGIDGQITEGDPTTQPPLCSREVMSYYGALLGDIPKSYIFKPWKTGVFFKKEENSNLEPNSDMFKRVNIVPFQSNFKHGKQIKKCDDQF